MDNIYGFYQIFDMIFDRAVLGQSERSTGVNMDAPNDQKWTVSESGRSWYKKSGPLEVTLSRYWIRPKPTFWNDTWVLHFLMSSQPTILCLLNRPLSNFLDVHLHCLIYSDRPLWVERWTVDPCPFWLKRPSTIVLEGVHFGQNYRQVLAGPSTFGWNVHFKDCPLSLLWTWLK